MLSKLKAASSSVEIKATLTASLDCWLKAFLSSCSQVKETMLQRFSIPRVLVMTHDAGSEEHKVTFQQNPTRLIFHSRPWTRDRKRRGEEVGKVHDRFKCQSCCQARTWLTTAQDREGRKKFMILFITEDKNV